MATTINSTITASNNGSITYSEPVSTESPIDTTTLKPPGLDMKQIGIIVAVLLGVLLITAVVLVVLLRRKRNATKRQSTQQAGGSGVYEATTAPIGDESKVMLKDGGQHEMKETKKDGEDKVDNINEASPLNGVPDTAVADPNESSANLVENDANSKA